MQCFQIARSEGAAGWRAYAMCTLACTVWCVSLVSSGWAYTREPFDGKSFRGTIAYSCDGNFNDPDDWAASPVSLALLARLGLQDKLVHFHYNSILWDTDPQWAHEHGKRVLTAAERFGFDRKRFFDCRQQQEAAVAHLAGCINAASAESPLYLVIAGPVDIARMALERCPSSRREWVYCISHSRWNDGYAPEVPFTANKRDVIALGVKWVQIADQNRLLSTSPYRRVARSSNRLHSPWAPAGEEDFAAYFWMRDAADAGVQFLWESLVASTRPDPSDAGMVYFLLSGDESATPEKLRQVLVHGTLPQRSAPRAEVRLEAENFTLLDGFAVESTEDRSVSHRLCVTPRPHRQKGILRTVFDEPYTAEAAVYDLTLRYLLESDQPCHFRFTVGSQVQFFWSMSASSPGWLEHTLHSVPLQRGNTITLEMENNLPRVDYFQLRLQRFSAESVQENRPAEPHAGSPTVAVSGNPGSALSAQHPRFAVTGPLDDSQALPGQVVVVGGRPGYLKINGGRHLFLCGPDNPEEFLYLGALRADGTRDGPQREIINFLGQSGVNAIHMMMFRMRRCNVKDEGDDTHCPFLNYDPSQPLNEKVLDQWDEWITELEKRGIIVHLEFYNDATDVERIGWTIDSHGNLHPDEQRFIDGIVQRFCRHRNVLWGVQESSNKLPRDRVRHFCKVAARIRQMDPYRHPIVQSFVTFETAEKDIHPDGVTSADYRDCPFIDVATWLHIPPYGADFDAQYRAYLRYAMVDRDRFITMRNETEYHPIDRRTARVHNWACALVGMHALEAQLNAARADRRDRIVDAGKVVEFMEQTDWYLMRPAAELASGSTKWVLANPGQSYIAYTYDYTGPMGLADLPGGTYELLWFDTITGKSVRSRSDHTGTKAAVWEKPEGVGKEVALYVKRKP